MNDLAALVAATLADPDAAPVLADWLQERGDPRGKLLRTRWKVWRTEEAKEDVVAREEVLDRLRPLREWFMTLEDRRYAELFEGSTFAAQLFKDYIRRKFPEAAG